MSTVAIASITPALTTTFAPTATSCLENRLTMLQNRGFEIWMNMPVPVPSSTFSDCWPSQFMSSSSYAAAGITQPAFNPLVCPENWSTVQVYTSNYIACCPSGYSLAGPTVSVKSDRPAFGGTCYTDLPSGVAHLVTAYGSTAVTATITFSPSVTNAQAYASPIEGYAFGVAQNPIIGSTTVGGAQNTSSTASPSATTPASAGTTYTVFADSEPTFLPSSLTAKVNDTIIFQFNSGNHSATQSSFGDPCSPVPGGFDSGFLINNGNTSATAPQASFKLLTTAPQFFYSKGSGDCGKGMVFVSNPTGSQSESAFEAKAIAKYGPKSHSVAIGVGVGVSIGAVLLGALGFFLWRRNTKQGDVGTDPDVYTPYKPSVYTHEHEQKSAVSHDGFEQVPAQREPMPPPHELHNYSQAYEMGASQDPYELQGSQQYGGRR